MYQFSEDKNSVVKIISDASRSYIPFAPGNRDYEEFLKWCAEGNTPEPYIPPTIVDGLTDLSQAKVIVSDSVRTIAYSILQPTDWYITRYTETQVEVPENITTFRSTIRTESASKIDQVNSQETLENLKDYLRSEEYSTWTTLE